MARAVWTLDCETDPFKRGRIPKPFVWGVYTGLEFRTFKTTVKMLEWVVDKDVIIYAHNGGKFDFHFFLDAIPEGERLTVIAGRVVAFKIGRAEFRDSWALLNVPLAAYKKDVIDYSKLEEDRRGNNWGEIIDYLRDDCIYLHELVIGFKEEFGLALTQASAAMREFQRMRGRKIVRGTPRFHDAMGRYYYGGRVECIEQGVIDVDFQAVDIRSAYPFAMTFEHPFSPETIRTSFLPKNDDEIGPCLITIQGRAHGVFPFRDPSRTTLCYPRDTLEREYHVSGWEYLAARETNAIQDWRVTTVHRPVETTTFGDYVSKFYDLRRRAKKDGDKARDIFYKIMLNALYGKFAADPRGYEFFTVANPKGLKLAPGQSIVANLGGTVLIREPSPESSHRFYNIATAASITGFVRGHLWKALARSDRPLYCDTDCVAAREITNIDVGDKLGQWGLEGEFDRAANAGRKLYAWRRRGELAEGQARWKTASKGVRLTAPEIVRAAQGEVVEYDPEVPSFSMLRGVGFTKRKVRMT